MATIPSLPLFTSGPLTSGKLNRLRDVIALWQNPPAAMARASASQNITTAGAYQLVTLHTSEFDTDTIVTSTTRFTVKTAGRYIVAATATFSQNGTGGRYVTVRKNAAGSPTGGTVIASGAAAPSSSSSTTVSLPANLRVQLAVNDTLEMFVYQDSGATLTLNSSPGDTFMLLQLDSVTATLSGTEATNIQSLHAESDLSTGDLDSVLSPGNYVQATAANATLARHYPVATVGGHLQVYSDGTASPTSTTQMFETTANALYIRHRAGTTWSAWASITGGGGTGGAVNSVNGQTGTVVLTASDVGAAATSHTHTSAQVTDFDAAVGSKAEVATLNNAFGARLGQPISPWQPEPTAGGNLWAVANFVNGGANFNITTLTPSLTPNGTSQTLITRAKYADGVAGNEAFRLEFDWTAPSDGWGLISITAVNGAGSTIAGTNEQLLVTNDSPANAGHYLIDLAPGVLSGSLFFDIKLNLANNSTTGSPLAISNVSMKSIPTDFQRPLYVSKHYGSGAWPYVYAQARDVVTDEWKMVEFDHSDEGNLTPYAFRIIDGFYDDQPFAARVPDPTMRRATASITDSIGNQQVTGTRYNLRGGNNDQVQSVWNGTAYELRGNVHGGEYTRTSPGVSVQIDQGSGWASYTPSNYLIGVRRVKVSIPTEFRRSTDGTTPYCTVDRTHTYFPDGMCRTDRTTTFTNSTQVNGLFEWMSSHDMGTPYVGRIGRGLTVLEETDSHPTVAAPTPTVATATTGGTLAAATYSYKVTALTPYGESLPSAAVTQATTGATSTVTISWSAVTNATGYRIYGRTGGVEKLLTTTASLSYVDTGSAVPIGDLPIVAKSRLYNATTVSTVGQSSAATWAVYYEPRSGWCYGNIYDRESILSRSGVSSARVRLMRGDGIQKNYVNVDFTGGNPLTVAAGTAWSATHWSFAYLPADRANYHNEIAVRAASIGALKNIYPIT